MTGYAAIRRFWKAVFTCVLIASVLYSVRFFVDFRARVMVQRYSDHVSDQITRERRRLSSYRRPIVGGAPSDQNAAVWYRLAFSNVASAPDIVPEIRHLVEQRDHSAARARVVFDGSCREVNRVRTRNALACTHCDWEIGYKLNQASIVPFHSQAAILGYCKLLSGAISQDEAHRMEAAQSYVEALMISSDLAQGDLAMNLTSIVIARAAFLKLGGLVSEAGRDQALIESVGRQLSALEGHLPTINTGFRLTAMWMASGILDEARRNSENRNGISRLVLPSTAVTAWHVAHYGRLLDSLRAAADSEDPTERAAEVNSELAQHRNVITDQLPGGWASLSDDASDLRQFLAADLIAIDVQSWYVHHGEYPLGGVRDSLRTGAVGIRYQRSNDGQDYRITGKSHSGEPTVFVDWHVER